jgi:tetratricopeptide (TPR) repeat protein
MLTGRSVQAVEIMERLLELRPTDIWLANNLAYTYVDQKIDIKRGLDVALAMQITAGDSMTGPLYDTLAWAFYRNKMLEEAESAGRQAVTSCLKEKDDDMAVVYYHLAEILFARQKYAETKDTVKAALELEPDNEVLLKLLKDSEQKLPASPQL